MNQSVDQRFPSQRVCHSALWSARATWNVTRILLGLIVKMPDVRHTQYFSLAAHLLNKGTNAVALVLMWNSSRSSISPCCWVYSFTPFEFGSFWFWSEFVVTQFSWHQFSRDCKRPFGCTVWLSCAFAIPNTFALLNCLLEHLKWVLFQMVIFFLFKRNSDQSPLTIISSSSPELIPDENSSSIGNRFLKLICTEKRSENCASPDIPIACPLPLKGICLLWSYVNTYVWLVAVVCLW